MTNFKGYVNSVQTEKEGLKIIVNIYDKEFVASEESPDDKAPVSSIVLNIPYNQPEDYVIDLITKAVEKHIIIMQDVENKKALIGREF